jgi:imidazolonepropionase-like amidohydrolase
LTPFEALRAATANAAEFLGVNGKQGMVATGHVANLVLLDSNPLTDIAHSRRIAGIMLRGRWIPRSEIDGMFERLAAQSAGEGR